MKKTLLAAIIAATALVPPAALAQDRAGRWQNRERAQSSNDGGQATRGSWRGNGGQRAQAEPQAQPQPQQQTQRSWGDRGTRGDGQARTWNRGGGDGAQNGGWRQRQSAQQAPQAQPAAPVPTQQSRGDRGQWSGQQRGDRGQWSGQQSRGDRRQWSGQQSQQSQQPQQWRGTRQGADLNRGWNDRNRDNRGGWNDRNRDNRGGWNNGWRNNNRYDWRGYRSTNRGQYRLPRYYAPSNWGYGYRRFSIGYTLSSILFGQQYWINDPYNYRLPDVYGPYRWVRYYNDALLVDIYTGEVVDTVYDIFW